MPDSQLKAVLETEGVEMQVNGDPKKKKSSSSDSKKKSSSHSDSKKKSSSHSDSKKKKSSDSDSKKKSSSDSKKKSSSHSDSKKKKSSDSDSKKKSSSDSKKKSSSDSKKKSSSHSDSKKKKSSDSDSKKKSSSDSKKKSSSDSKKKSSSHSDSKKKKSSDSDSKKKSSSDSKKKSSSDSKKKSSSHSDSKKKKSSDSDSKKKSSSDSKKKSSSESKKKSSSDSKKKSSSDEHKKKKSDSSSKSKSDKSFKDKGDKSSKSKSDKPFKDKGDKSSKSKSDKSSNDKSDKPAKDDSPKKTKDQGPDKAAKDALAQEAYERHKKILKEHNDKKVNDTVVQHLYIEEPDVKWGSLYIDRPAPLSSHILKVELPDLKFVLRDEEELNHEFFQLIDPKFRENFRLYEGAEGQPAGITGNPVDYEYRNDDAVTSILLLSFFLMAWVIAASWKFVRSQLKGFFITRERPNLFAEREDNVLRGRGFLIFQTSFLLSLLFFTSTRDVLPDVFKELSPRLILLTGTCVSLAYYGIKIATYNLVNHTFFSPAKCLLWSNIYFVSILLTGCSLLPVVLAVVFFDVPFADVTFPCILLLAVIKILLFYKCFRIFFNSLLGCVHLILYFCALEIIPLGIFAFSIVAAATNLLQLDMPVWHFDW